MESNETAGTAGTAGRELAVAKPTLPTFDLSPRTLAEALEYAKLMAGSSLVPKQFRDNPGDVLIAVQMGAEVGLSPMAALQNIAVINGKPGFYGDVGKALLLAHGCAIDEADVEEIKKTGTARCTIQRAGRNPVTRTFSVEDAKTAKLWGKEGPWTNYPQRQMAWRAFWFAARDGAADILKGLAGAEELEDIALREARNITPGTAGAERSGPADPPRKSERAADTKLTLVQEPSAPAAEEKPAAAAAAAGAEPAPPNGHGDLKKTLNEVFQVMPRYNRAKGEGSAGRLLEENYHVAQPSKLTPEQAAQFLRTMKSELGVVA